MDQILNSSIFGEMHYGSDDERLSIARTVTETPILVFQELNRVLNQRGLSLAIVKLENVANREVGTAAG